MRSIELIFTELRKVKNENKGNYCKASIKELEDLIKRLEDVLVSLKEVMLKKELEYRRYRGTFIHVKVTYKLLNCGKKNDCKCCKKLRSKLNKIRRKMNKVKLEMVDISKEISLVENKIAKYESELKFKREFLEWCISGLLDTNE